MNSLHGKPCPANIELPSCIHIEKSASSVAKMPASKGDSLPACNSIYESAQMTYGWDCLVLINAAPGRIYMVGPVVIVNV